MATALGGKLFTTLLTVSEFGHCGGLDPDCLRSIHEQSDGNFPPYTRGTTGEKSTEAIFSPCFCPCVPGAMICSVMAGPCTCFSIIVVSVIKVLC